MAKWSLSYWYIIFTFFVFVEFFWIYFLWPLLVELDCWVGGLDWWSQVYKLYLKYTSNINQDWCYFEFAVNYVFLLRKLHWFCSEKLVFLFIFTLLCSNCHHLLILVHRSYHRFHEGLNKLELSWHSWRNWGKSYFEEIIDWYWGLDITLLFHIFRMFISFTFKVDCSSHFFSLELTLHPIP